MVQCYVSAGRISPSCLGLEDSERHRWLWLEYQCTRLGLLDEEEAVAISDVQLLAAFSALSKYTTLRGLRLQGENSKSMHPQARTVRSNSTLACKSTLSLARCNTCRDSNLSKFMATC